MNPRPVLIIADSLLGIIKAIHGRGSIAVQEYQIVDRFKCMSDRFSIPILVIHHSRKLKGDAIESAMGTGAIPAACDDVWALAREAGNEAILPCQGRDAELRTYRFCQQPTGFWVLVEKGSATALGPIRRKIVNFVIENPGLAPKELSERLRIHDKTLSTHLRRPSDDGFVHRGERGYEAAPQDAQSDV